MPDEETPLEQQIRTAVDYLRSNQAEPGEASVRRPTVTVPSFGESSPIPPSEDDLNNNVDRIVNNLSGLEYNEPWLSQSIAGSPAAMAISQEVAATVPDPDMLSYAIGTMLGDEKLDEFDESVIDRLDNKAPVVAQFYQDYGGKLDPQQKAFIAFLLSPLDAERRAQTVALGHQYIEANGLEDETAHTNLMVFLAQVAEGKINEYKSEGTILGRLGEAVDSLGEPIREWAASTWANTADPGESVYREHLSIGQNVAISLGQTPGTEGWEIASAVTDGIAQFTLDPIAWATGMKAGTSLAQSFPRMTDAGKVATSFKAAAPWFGKHATDLPRFSRGWTTRLGWALQSRNLDEMFEAGAAGRKLANSLYDTAQRGGIAAVRESFPVMERAMDGIGDLIVRSNNEDEVVDILREALTGGFVNPNAALNSQLKNAFEQSQSAYNEVVDGALDSGEIGLGDLGGLEGFKPGGSGIFAFSGEVKAGMALADTTLEGAGDVKMVLRGAERSLDLSDAKEVNKVAKWLQENGTVAGDNVLANRLIAGQQMFTQQMVDRLDAYAVAAGMDTIRFGDNVILTSKGVDRAVTGIDKTTDANRLVSLTSDLAEDLIVKHRQYDTALKGNTDLWVLNEMPARAPRGLLKQVKGLWRHSAPTDASGWWGKRVNVRSAQIFNKKAPSAVDIDNTADMIEGFRRWARSFGAGQDWINTKINELASTRFMDRHDAISRAIIELSDEVDHPLLRHRLVEYLDGQTVREFMPGPGGVEMATAVSRSDGVTQTAVPLIPSLMRRSVRLPGPEFHRSFLRYRRSQQSNLGFIHGKGIWKGTRDKRTEIIKNLKRRIQRKIDATEDPNVQKTLQALINDESRLTSMAYASVFEHGIGNGLGVLAQTGAMLNRRLYTPFHNFFSVAQLAFRPASWMQRVNLDEQARGALTGLPSIFRNPGQYMRTWWDAYHIAKAEKYAVANSTWATQTAETLLRGGDEMALARVFNVFPEARKALGETPNASQLRRFVNDQLRGITQGQQPLRGLSAQMDMGRWASRRVRQQARAQQGLRRIEKNYGLKPGFEWDDAAEIQMQGTHMALVDELGGSVSPLDWTPSITEQGAYQFGGAWASKSGQYVRDPAMQSAMRAAVLSARGQKIRPAAVEIVRSKNWYEMRRNFIATATQQGWDDVLDDDVLLAERILEKVLVPQVDHIFSPMWNQADEAVSTKIRVLEDLLSPGRTSTFTAHDGLEYTFDFRKSSSSGLRQEMRKFTAEERDRLVNRNLSVGMPDRIAAHFDPFYAADDGLYGAGLNAKGVTSTWRRFTDWSIATFGERATQNLNRRPAYLAAHRRNFRRFKALGLDDDAARLAAHGEATRLVNYVYYNMDDTVPMLRKMNKVIPFFSAAWEVAQTWAYKLPNEIAGGAGFVYGYPKMIRSVDRFFDAFINAGLIQVLDSDGKEDREARNLIERMGIPYQLVLSQNNFRGEAQPIANFLSAAGNHLVNTPFTIVEHLANLGSSLAEATEDIDYLGDAVDAVTPDEKIDLGSPNLRLTLANPLDPLGEGVGNALSFHLGLNPAVSYALATQKDKIYAAVDGKTLETTGQTFAEIAEATGIDDQEMLRVNGEAITEAIGLNDYNKLIRGDLPLEDYVLPDGVSLNIPRSSLIGTVVDDLFFAFDSAHSPEGVAYHMQPSWSKYIWRGFGLWAGNDGHPPGFLEIFDGPVGAQQMEAANTDALRYLEANEGAVTKVRAQATELHQFIQDNADTFLWDPLKKTITGTPGIDQEAFAAAEERYQELKADLDAASMSLMSRASDLAGGQLLTRGLFGLFLPSNPSTYNLNAHLEDAYWDSKEFAEGEGTLRVGNATDYETFAKLMIDWWEDPTGDAGMMFLKEYYPGMEMFLKGSSYWVEGTKPIEAQDAEDYFRLRGEGLIDTMPGEIWLMDQVKSGMSLRKEAEIRETFGHDPQEAVFNMLTNYNDYKQINEELEISHAEYEWYDDLFLGGEYGNFQERERRTASRLAEEIKLAEIDKFKNLDSIADTVAEIADATPDEAAALSRQLAQYNREARDQIYELMDLPEYQGAIGEREKILGQWWEEVDSYYEELGEIFAPLQDPSLTSEDRGLVFEKYRVFQNEMNGQPVVIDGVEYPNEVVRSWSSKTEEERQAKRLRDITKKPEWLSTVQVDHIVERYPDAAGYLPTDQGLYDIFTNFKDENKRLVELGELSKYRADQYNAEAEEAFYAVLESEGRSKEIVWMEATPMERLEIIDDVPPYLESIMPFYHNLVGTLRANDISLASTSEDAKKIRVAFGNVLYQHLDNVPGGNAAFVELGRTMFGDDFDAKDKIGAVLFLNDRFNDL